MKEQPRNLADPALGCDDPEGPVCCHLTDSAAIDSPPETAPEAGAPGPSPVPARPPHASWRGRVATLLLVFVASLAIFGVGAHREVNVFDEGTRAYGAARILEGEVPYRDFHVTYGPLTYYLRAAALWLFGDRLLTIRWLDVVTAAGIAVLLFGLAHAAGGLVPAALALFSAWGLLVPPWHTYSDQTLLCLLGALALLRARRSSPTFIASGALGGMAALFRPDLGLLGGAALWLTLWLDPPAGSRRSFRPVLWLGGALATALPPTLSLFLYAGSGLWDDLLVRAIEIQSHSGYPFPAPLPDIARLSLEGLGAFFDAWARQHLPIYLVLIALAVSVTTLVRAWPRAREAPDRFVPMAATALVTAALLPYALGRTEILHVTPALLLTTLLVAHLWGARPSGRHRLRSTAQALAALLYLSVAGAGLAARASVHWSPAAERGLVPLPFTRAEGLLVPPRYAAAITEIVRYLQAHTAPGEAIFAGCARHDRVFYNDALVLYFAERPSATAFVEHNPGVITDAAVQKKVVEELAERQVRYAVLFRAPDDPASRTRLVGATLLDSRLLGCGRTVLDTGLYRVLDLGGCARP